MDIYHSTVYSPKICETTEMSFHVRPCEINEGTAYITEYYAASKMEVLTGKDTHCMLLS